VNTDVEDFIEKPAFPIPRRVDHYSTLPADLIRTPVVISNNPPSRKGIQQKSITMTAPFLGISDELMLLVFEQVSVV
jgi:hypothetical protein